MTLSPEEEFKKYYDRLRKEVDKANWHLSIVKYISKSSKNYIKEIDKTPVFWGLTFIAHKFSVLTCLNNLFGKSEKEKFLHMSSFLDFVKNNLDIFSPEAFEKRLTALGRYNELAAAFDSKITRVKVEQDMGKLRNLPISSLKSWRNKALSHIDKDSVKNSIKIERRHPIKAQHIEKIIETLQVMLNEYSLHYDFSTHGSAIEQDIECDIEYIFGATRLKMHQKSK